ncbi:hypothetical protein [Pseudomonas sp. L13]|uniref:hypothetical protein n=1 Tax=Pseudomonas sp. L13 TaxID=343985 RepID=UPI00137A0031|nr:hypothetical protein [Pseudomonas sp. L13]
MPPWHSNPATESLHQTLASRAEQRGCGIGQQTFWLGLLCLRSAEERVEQRGILTVFDVPDCCVSTGDVSDNKTKMINASKVLGLTTSFFHH